MWKAAGGVCRPILCVIINILLIGSYKCPAQLKHVLGSHKECQASLKRVLTTTVSGFCVGQEFIFLSATPFRDYWEKLRIQRSERMCFSSSGSVVVVEESYGSSGMVEINWIHTKITASEPFKDSHQQKRLGA